MAYGVRWRCARLPIAILIGCTLAVWSARPQPNLYGVQPAAGSGFVRVVNATGQDIAVDARELPYRGLGHSTQDRIGTYVTLPAANGYKFRVTASATDGSAHLDILVAANTFTTILVQMTQYGVLQLVPVTVEVGFNQAKARLVFYNASADCVTASVGLVPNGLTVFADVASSNASSRVVNPSHATLAIACDGIPAGSVDLDGMHAGDSYSLWLLGSGSGTRSFLNQDAVWRP